MPSRTRKAAGGRDELSQLLVDLRGDRTQGEAAARIGVTQSRISRAESGKGGLTPEQAERYARALGASAADRKRLVQLVRTFAAEQITSRTTLVRRQAEIQDRIARLYEESTLIRSWQPEVIPGALQTRDYTLAVVGPPPPDSKWWGPRLERIAMLERPGRTYQILVSEAVLRWGVVSREVMAAQMARLIEVSRLRWVQLGVVPLDTVHPIVAPRPFELYGSRMASVATDSGTAFVDEPRDIAQYEQEFAAVAELARYGDAARALVGALWA